MKILIQLLIVFIFGVGLALPSFSQSMTKSAAKQYVVEQNRSLDEDTLISIILNEEMDNYDLALQLCRVLEDIANKKKDLTNKYKSFRIRGIIYETYQKEDSALIAHNVALNIAKKIKGEEGQMRRMMSMLDIAIVYTQKMEYKDSYLWFEKLLKQADENEDDDYKMYAYYGIGEIYTGVYEHNKAIEAYYQALDLSKQAENLDGIVSTLQVIAETHGQAGQEELAKKIFNEAFEIIEKEAEGREKEALLGHYYLTLGDFYMEEKENTKAMECFSKGIDIFKKLNEPYETVICYMRAGEAALNLNKTELALEYLLLAYEGREYFYDEELAEFFYHFGNVSLEENNLENASDYFRKSLDLSLENDIKEVAQKSYYGLYKYKNAKEDYKNALNYYIKYTDLDTVFTSESQSKAVAEMRFKYLMSDNERKIEQLQRKNLQNTFIITATALLIILGILFYLYRSRVKSNTLLQQKNEEINQQFRRLKESHIALEQFAYVAAHDLKEPLRTIGGYSSLMKRRLGKMDDTEQKEYLSFMTEASSRLSNLLDDLLFYADISKELPGTETVSLKNTIEQTLDLISTDIQNTKAIINYEKIDKQTLQAKPAHIVQLFKEIISNAIKFNENKPVIDIDIFQNNEQLQLTFIDNGIGLEESYKHKVFNIFNRLDKKSGYTGTGVGLTIAKNIVEKYGGKIDYNLNDSGGTNFIILFKKI